MDERTKIIGAIAEITISSPDLATYRRSAMDELQGWLGFDAMTIQNTLGGIEGFPPSFAEPFARNSERFVGEFLPEEARRMAIGRTQHATEVFSKRRRERIAMFDEWLIPNRATNFVGRAWAIPGAVAGLGIYRTGVGARWSDRDFQCVDAVVPMLSVAEHFLTARIIGSENALHAWASALGLTTAETKVVELVLRGLTNRQAALMLRCSAHTVRNHLVKVFGKARVSTRSQLAYAVLSSAPAHPSTKPLAIARFVDAVHEADRPILKP